MRKGFGIAALAKLGYRPLRRCGGVRKRILRLDRLRLRGLSGAKDEVLLTATAQNPRRSSFL